MGWSSWRIAAEGVGVLGLNNNVVWGLDIVHFVFWIGLGHAGTLISAVLLLTRQSWRSPIARGAELMTLCAVVCAAVFPVVHVGRVWMAWMAGPLPEVSGIWPDMASPLMWDVMAVSTYFLLSLTYWYIGLIPDFALLRDCCTERLKRRYGLLALGWQGTGRQWRAYEKASLLFAAILTPLVVSVHSVVSFDFSVTQVPGWHQSIFPPYFVGGAILSGMAMVQLILLAVRRLMAGSGVREAITPAILNLSSKFVLALALVMGAMYLWEHMAVLLNGGAPELFPGRNPVGPVFMAAMIAGERGSAPVILVPLPADQSARHRRGGPGGACRHVDGAVLDCGGFPEGVPAGGQCGGLLSQPDGPGHDGRKRGPVYGLVHDPGTRHALLFPV